MVKLKLTSSCLSIFYFTKRNLISRTFIYSITRKSFFKYNLKIIENVIHIMAILFLKFSQMSFSEWGGWGWEYHKDTQQCLQALCPWENHLHWGIWGQSGIVFTRYVCHVFVCLLTFWKQQVYQLQKIYVFFSLAQKASQSVWSLQFPIC